jgi:hypothetical protein
MEPHKAINKENYQRVTPKKGRRYRPELRWTSYCGEPGETTWRWFNVGCVKCFQKREREKTFQWERKGWDRDEQPNPTNP